MPRAVTMENVGHAFEVVKAMQADGLTFGDDGRPLARAALAQLLEERMAVGSSVISTGWPSLASRIAATAATDAVC